MWPSTTLSIVVGYRDCPTDNVLPPGSPCRDEDEMKIPSRVADSFLLELRTAPPLQNEELAVIDFIAWLRQIGVSSTAPTPLADFETVVAAAGQVVASPPQTPQSPGMQRLRFDPPPAALRIDPADAGAYLRAAFRGWTTTIPTRGHSLCCGGQGCCSGNPAGVAEPEDLLLLGTVTIPVGADWKVDTTPLGSPPPHATLRLDESARPTLLHTRMLQELSIAGVDLSQSTSAAPATYRVVAAGIVNAPGGIVMGGLTGSVLAAGRLKLRFTGYQDPRTSPPSFTYVVKALPQNPAAASTVVAFDSFDVDGVVLNVTRSNALLAAPALGQTQFMIEVSRLG